MFYSRLKRTSPTAYCDCWEKCPCKALVSGEQDKRKELLYKLVEETDLSTKPNNKWVCALLIKHNSYTSMYCNNKFQYIFPWEFCYEIHMPNFVLWYSMNIHVINIVVYSRQPSQNSLVYFAIYRCI